MGATTRLTFEDFLKIPEREGTIYELDEGELVMEPSPILRDETQRWKTVLQTTHWSQDGEWHSCTDRVRVSVEGEMLDLHEGDEAVDLWFLAHELRQYATESQCLIAKLRAYPIVACGG